MIDGAGMHGLKTPAQPLDLGNSGTGIRLLLGLLAGQGVEATLTGDASLRQRPMERVAEPAFRPEDRIGALELQTLGVLDNREHLIQHLESVARLASRSDGPAFLVGADGTK